MCIYMSVQEHKEIGILPEDVSTDLSKKESGRMSFLNICIMYK